MDPMGDTAPTVCITDRLPDAAADTLREGGLTPIALWMLPDDAARARALDVAAGGLVRTLTSVNRAFLDRCPRIRALATASSGFDHVDIPACRERGIPVFYAPEANGLAAAEHAMALLLALAREIPDADRTLRDGRWERDRFMARFELSGRVAHVVGLGRVGTRVARRLLAFDMTILATDPYVTRAQVAYRDALVAGTVEFVPLAEGLARADVVTLHVPLTAETTGLIGPAELARMRAHALIVNTARGPVLDLPALESALADPSRGPAGAGIDVWPQEPPDPQILQDLARTAGNRLVATPHLGAATPEAKRRVAIEAAAALVRALVHGDMTGRLE